MLRQVSQTHQYFRKLDQRIRSQTNSQISSHGKHFTRRFRRKTQPRLLREARETVITLYAQEYRKITIEGT